MSANDEFLVTHLESEDLQLKEDHIQGEVTQSTDDAEEDNESSIRGPINEGDDDGEEPELEKEKVVEAKAAEEPSNPDDLSLGDMKWGVTEEAVHNISAQSKRKQEEFLSMHDDIQKKIEMSYGKGNGDYEVYDDLYELVPDRLPVNDELVGSITKLVDYIVFLIDLLYQNEPYKRFYVLETIARVPYFSYISALHYLETIGYKNNIPWLRIHWAEGWNELHHLLIMEELGGDKRWFDRFLAQHTAVLYYWVVVVLYFLTPSLAYNLSEQIEKHAYETYDKFLKENADMLKKQPAPAIAIEYYESKTYMFDDFQSCREPGTRRPVIRNLYDVFFNIRNDEAEHFKTMV